MQDGFTLLIVGMGTVFAFLALLVVAMAASARFLARFFPGTPDPVPERSPVDSTPEIALALAAAHAHFSTPGRSSPQ